jgi:hypothetical protein
LLGTQPSNRFWAKVDLLKVMILKDGLEIDIDGRTLLGDAVARIHVVPP